MNTFFDRLYYMLCTLLHVAAAVSGAVAIFIGIAGDPVWISVVLACWLFFWWLLRVTFDGLKWLFYGSKLSS